MIELDIDSVDMESRTVRWKGNTLMVDRVLMNPARDMVIFIGNSDGKRKAIRANIRVGETQAIIMGDLNPFHINPI